MRASEQDGRIRIEGVGVAFLRFKSKMAVLLGTDAIRTENRGAFSIPFESAFLASELLAEIGYHSEALERAASVAVQHKSAREESLRIIRESDMSGVPSDWRERLEDYQAVAVNAMMVSGLAGFCLFDEQGTGKTVMTIAAFDCLRVTDAIEKMLVVCPKTMQGEWQNAFAQFTSDKYQAVVITGDMHSRIESLSEPADIYVINFEAVAPMLVRLKAFVKSKKCLLVADESYYVKNKDAQRSAAMRELRTACERAFVLCGTPAPNSPADLINQFDLADGGYTFRGVTPSGDRTRDAETIYEAVSNRGVYLRRLKGQVLPHLPPKQFEIVPVDLDGAQQNLYLQAKDKLVLHLRNMTNEIFSKNLSDYFAKRNALLQICTCPAAIDPMFAGEHAKLKALDNIVAEVVEKENRKVVIWSYYRLSLDEIAARYARLGIVRIDGGVSDSDRKKAISRFQKDDSIRIFVGNPAAAGAGITLHAASDSVFVSFSNQAAHFLQALDRTHRIGQQAKEIRYHLIICNGTIEKNEIRILRDKELRQHELLDPGAEWPSSLEEALEELEDEN